MGESFTVKMPRRSIEKIFQFFFLILNLELDFEGGEEGEGMSCRDSSLNWPMKEIFSCHCEYFTLLGIFSNFLE